jgi:FAD/FMN-containing dehydrogenase
VLIFFPMVKGCKRPILATIALLVVALVLAAAKKVFDYAAPPSAPKDCNFIFPSGADPTKLTRIVVDPPKNSFSLAQRGGYINDASCLNKTAVYGIVEVHSVDDIRNALAYAREHHLKVTAAGQRHSMGGQSFTRGGLVLDMREFNQLQLDKKNKIVTAQTGATWKQIQIFLDPQGLALQAMQSINIFSVGGTMSVNAHGIAHRPGPLAGTVKSFRIMLADGQIKTASPTENPELFRLALGGYGLFGVLIDADLQLVDNQVYHLQTEYMDYRDFPEYYRQHVAGNDDVGLIFGRISVSPSSYLRETAIHVYRKANFDGPVPALKQEELDWLGRLVINFSKTGGLGRRVRWALEKRVEPRLHPCIVSRNQAMNAKEPCLVSRNQEMYDAMGYLENRLHDTDILQEYFIVPEKMPEFVDGLRDIVARDRANLLNVTIRIVHQDRITALPYAKRDMFAFVLYFNQKLNEEQSRRLEKTTVDLIDLAVGLKGTFYLPYQLYYSPAELRGAYPEVDEFFAAKRKYDPEELFGNKFYEKYGKGSAPGS